MRLNIVEDMTTLIGYFMQKYNRIWLEDKYADPRPSDLFLMSSPATIFTIVASYLYFCTKLGPRLMEKRKPYNLKDVMLVYNILAIFISCYVFFQGVLVFTNYSLICQPLDYSDTPFNRWVMHIGHVYVIGKLIELLDTVFFVLRKKYSQVRFLHLFHHTLMLTGSWLGLRYGLNSGHGIMFGVINSLVHIIMYGYYLIAGLGPQYQKYLWWKKYLTLLQLIQFTIVFLHNIFPLFTSCTYPKSIHLFEILMASAFIYMFGKFYIKTYLKNPPAGKQK